MKRIAGILFSSRLMAIIMAIFAVSIAIATFIENDFGSASAQSVVYNARWFELLLMLGGINLIGNIFIKKLYSRPTLTIFIFHMAFILMLAGAAITRYTGFEGTMAIREGQDSDTVLTDQPYIQVIASNAETVSKNDFPVFFSGLGRNKFNETIRFAGKSFRLACTSFVSNAFPVIEPDDEGGPVAEIAYTDSAGRKSIIIKEGEIKSIGTLIISFDCPVTDSQTIVLAAKGDSLVFIAPYQVSMAGMPNRPLSRLEKMQPHNFIPSRLYSFTDRILVLNKYLTRGKILPKALSSSEGQTYDAVVMELTSDTNKTAFIVWGKEGYEGIKQQLVSEGVAFLISYGSIYKKLPFKLKLNDFIIDRYPGSQSPSWFESHVTLTDRQRNVMISKRIYMNNMLKYRGYRFYQSSYDPDEKGTILSVNHDWAGMLVTYSGYLLMGLGMAFSLFNPNSHFRNLFKEINMLKNSRKGLTVVLFLFLFKGFSFTQDTITTKTLVPIDVEHARIFGKMLIQDNSGRIEPVNTLCAEVLRKVYYKSTYKGMNADQVFVGMLVDPVIWQHEPIIRVTNPKILEIMDSDNNYYSFSSFFRNNNYILQNYVEEAFQKKPASRSKFDNEIIRLDERVNICYLVFTGELLRIFPVPGDSSHTWYSHQGIQGRIDTGDSVFVENIIPLYIQDVQHSLLTTVDWKSADNIITAISNYQKRYSSDIIPSPRKVSLEIVINASDIFARISNYYGLIGFVLLLLQFTGLFFTRLKLNIPKTVSIILIITLFALHSAGLGMRWYVSGHAPWSNGYEALTYIAWATVLAGLIFFSTSSITLSVTSILAFIILHVAHLSWMDTQITNLVPVLKSYWLVIHVATITASYGFLFLSALLAFINLLLMILQTRRNKKTVQLTIRELSSINEMSLIIGLYLLTIGTFLGAIWANESWGRYWGWDPKETWALITVLAYAFIIHMRMVPGLKGTFAFNLASLLGISTVIMTYFGVNYYLSGLHSYAKGDPLPVPNFVYYIMSVILITALLAYFNNQKMKRFI